MEALKIRWVSDSSMGAAPVGTRSSRHMVASARDRVGSGAGVVVATAS
jgi:hypothetical protein